MKKLGCLIVLSALFLLIFIAACGNEPIGEIGDNFLVKIERAVKLHQDPILCIVAKKVKVDHEGKIIICDEVISLGGKNWQNFNWPVEVKIENNKLIIPIPDKTEYKITIETEEKYQYKFTK